MPGILEQRSGRRSFLRTVGMGGAWVLAARGSAVRALAESGPSLHLALLSDTHIPADPGDSYRGFRPVENLQTVVPQVAAAEPAGVVINGDAARLTGEVEDYRQLASLLEPMAKVAPVFIGLGNHDNRQHFFETVEAIPGARQSVRGKHVVAIEHAAVRVLVLDSLLYVDKVAGLLGKAQRAWLAAYLGQPDERPVVLVVHHTLGDGDGDLLDVDRLFRVIAPTRRVKAIFYGHSHQYRYSIREDVHLVNLPAVGYNFSDAEPVGWVDATFRPDGVDLTLHACGGNTADNGKTTNLTWIS